MENIIIIFLNCQKSFINTLNLKQVVANVRKDTKDCQTYKTEKPLSLEATQTIAKKNFATLITKM